MKVNREQVVTECLLVGLFLTLLGTLVAIPGESKHPKLQQSYTSEEVDLKQYREIMRVLEKRLGDNPALAARTLLGVQYLDLEEHQELREEIQDCVKRARETLERAEHPDLLRGETRGELLHRLDDMNQSILRNHHQGAAGGMIPHR